MLNELRKAIVVALLVMAVLSACAPAQAPAADIQSQVATQVAMTVQAQSNMAQAVAQTLTAQAPVATATVAPTQIVLSLPTADPSLATVTPFVVVPSSGGNTGGTKPKYSCSWQEVKPKTNVFRTNDEFNVKWIITNTGTATWPSALDLDLVSSTMTSSFVGKELPPLKPGDNVTIEFEAQAPGKVGFYGMQFKVQGGLCFPALNIEVTHPDP